MNIEIPAKLYDAMTTIQKHCARLDGCIGCCFFQNISPRHTDFRCILEWAHPSGWSWSDVVRAENTIRPKNKRGAQ